MNLTLPSVRLGRFRIGRDMKGRSPRRRTGAPDEGGMPGRILKKAGLTASGGVLLSMAITGWVLARLLGGRAVYLLVYGTLIVMGVSWLMGRRRLAVRALRSELPSRVRAGQPVEVSLEFEARQRLSNVIVEEHLPAELGRPVRIPLTAIAKGNTKAHTYTFTPKRRGVYEVGPLSVTWGDPFGLTTRRSLLSEPQQILVHPVIEPIADRVVSREWEDPPIRPPFFKPWPTGFEFYGMRDYVEGDDPRRIIWRATARTLDPVMGTTRYFVRESEQGITDRVTMLLDTDDRSHSAGDTSDTFETAIRVVASLGVRHLKDGFAVSLDGNGSRMIPSIRGGRSSLLLLDELAKVQTERARLWEGIERLSRDRGRNFHCVIVTPRIDDDAAGRLRLLIDRGASVVVAMTVSGEPDVRSAERAAAVGASLVEVSPGTPLQASFGRLVGSGVRRGRG